MSDPVVYLKLALLKESTARKSSLVASNALKCIEVVRHVRVSATVSRQLIYCSVASYSLGVHAAIVRRFIHGS